MVILDIVLGLLLAWGLIKGLKNGLIIEIASLLALIAGLYAAFHFSGVMASSLRQYLSWEEQSIALLAFIATFILVVVLVHLAAKLLTRLVSLAMLGLLNRVAGGFFGLMKVAVVLGALIVFYQHASTSLPLPKPSPVKDSLLLEPLTELGNFIFREVARALE